MNALIISGRILKSVIIIIMIALSVSLLGLFESGSRAYDEAKLSDNNIELIKKSEYRIKRNIEKITTLEDGLNLYRFQYRSEPNIYVGFMANDLARHQKYKHFVVDMGAGNYTIHYEKLGFQPITYKEWQISGMSAFTTSTNVAQKETKK